MPGAGSLLRGKALLIAGGSRGLGRSVALGAARLGARVGVLARSKPDLEALRQQIERDTGQSPLIVTADVRDPAAVEAAVEAARDRFGGIDIALYNAGIGYWEPVTAMPEERWDETLDVNLKGAFLFTRAVLPGMLARHSGQLLYVSSRIAVDPIPGYAAYAASKAGLRAFAEVVAKEAAGQGIRVTTIVAGLIDTAFSDIPHGRPPDQRPPRDLMLTTDEVAEQILHVVQTSENAWVKEVILYPARL